MRKRSRLATNLGVKTGYIDQSWKKNESVSESDFLVFKQFADLVRSTEIPLDKLTGFSYEEIANNEEQVLQQLTDKIVKAQKIFEYIEKQKFFSPSSGMTTSNHFKSGIATLIAYHQLTGLTEHLKIPLRNHPQNRNHQKSCTLAELIQEAQIHMEITEQGKNQHLSLSPEVLFKPVRS